MRGTLRVLLSLILGGSLALAAIPRQPFLPEVQQTDCCAKMTVAKHECERHMPKSDPDQECCPACTFGLAAVITSATPLVYPSVGDENFAAYISFERTRSQRPPVPPPRA